LEVVAGAARKLDDPEIETETERYEGIEDEPGTPVAPRVQLEVEGTVEGWGSLGIDVRTTVTPGVGVEYWRPLSSGLEGSETDRRNEESPYDLPGDIPVPWIAGTPKTLRIAFHPWNQ